MYGDRAHLQRAAILVVAGLAGSASAADVYLVATPISKVMPGGLSVPMWGFAPATAGFATVGPATVPGPVLVVPPGDSTLTVHLRNDLPEPVSLVIPGQLGSSTVHTFTDAQGRSRIDSFAALTAPASTGAYVFTALRPGTYLYHSGTHASVQVPMGLYGALTVDESAGMAYAGVPYVNQAVVVLSEVDPALNQAITGGTYGTPTYPSTMSFRPKLFLINGAPHPAGSPLFEHPLTAGERTLFRFLNAGLDTHVPVFDGLYVQVVAEDGNLYRHPREQYTVTLAAGKTSDVLLVPPAAGSASLYDGRLFLVNADSAAGGMLSRLTIAPAVGAPTTVADNYSVAEDGFLTVAAPGVLANDTGASLLAQLVETTHAGALTLETDGSLAYRPLANFSGADSFTYRAMEGLVPGNVVTVQLTVTPVNDAPVATGDTATVFSGQTVTVSVLTNDSDLDGDALSVGGFSQPTHGSVIRNADETLSYSSTAGYAGPDAFTYTAFDGAASSAAATVSITVNPRINIAPVAVNDSASTRQNTSVRIDVAANDSDPDGTVVRSSVTILSGPTRGGTVVNHRDGTVTYTPRRNFRGTDTFRYSISDQDGAPSNAATVSVNVTR